MPLSPSGAELLFEVFSRRYERGSILVTSNLPFDEWTSVFGAERLTGALLDRLTHHVHILEMNGESYRLKASRRRQGKTRGPDQRQLTAEARALPADPHASAGWYSFAPPRRYAIDPAFTVSPPRPAGGGHRTGSLPLHHQT